jgi:probable addiction module antidote protein
MLDFNEELRKSLNDPKEAAAYLQAARMEADADSWLIALQTLAQVKGGLTLLSKKTGINRVHLYRMLGKSGNPTFRNVLAILKSLSVDIKFVPIKDEPIKAHRAPKKGKKKAAVRQLALTR